MEEFMKSVKEDLEIVKEELSEAEEENDWSTYQRLVKRQTALVDIIFMNEIMPQLIALKKAHKTANV